MSSRVAGLPETLANAPCDRGAAYMTHAKMFRCFLGKDDRSDTKKGPFTVGASTLSNIMKAYS